MFTLILLTSKAFLALLKKHTRFINLRCGITKLALDQHEPNVPSDGTFPN